ncbi:hypothetical protein DSO57_1013287 [Entomophthora muscae]|uniref:Uncharacterized protein n=1 Tax=Entomophthora muscae TaxID=34485 RepID=A0ACC2SUU0_9FUNG|nr:hypothetical protein DSO57_1013287 [Entomophthora muscae]
MPADLTDPLPSLSCPLVPLSGLVRLTKYPSNLVLSELPVESSLLAEPFIGAWWVLTDLHRKQLTQLQYKLFKPNQFNFILLAKLRMAAGGSLWAASFYTIGLAQSDSSGIFWPAHKALLMTPGGGWAIFGRLLIMFFCKSFAPCLASVNQSHSPGVWLYALCWDVKYVQWLLSYAGIK